jgi:hypothetical protein
LRQLRRSFAKAYGLFYQPGFCFSQLICDVKVICKGKPITENCLFPDHLFQDLAGNWILSTADNQQVFSSSSVKGMPEASLVLAVHFWI